MSSHRGKNCGKWGKSPKFQFFAAPQGVWTICTGFPREMTKECFSTAEFSFSTRDVEFVDRAMPYRLALILVLISLTVSANAASFFIFFSTCWME